jgi:UDP-N-acetylglucosamine 2-epimerase
MTQDQSLAEMTARLMLGFAQRFAAKRPDLVLAQGDTTTVLCAARAASTWTSHSAMSRPDCVPSSRATRSRS